MNKKILVIGQCSLHWEVEFEIGNFYIMEPFFRLLHEQFPKAEIKTTFQMSSEFCDRKYSMCSWSFIMVGIMIWKLLKKKFTSLKILSKQNQYRINPYIDLVKEMDLVIDFSGIFGDNADFWGLIDFMLDCKDRVAQVFAKNSDDSGSPGPFSAGKPEFAKEVYENFDLVTNREGISKGLLESYGFNTATPTV